MAQLAIKGHATRGKEVIELLEMLGGENKYHINITEENLLYTIREGDNAIIATYPNSSINKIFTFEEFLVRFPYKVGDKVRFKGHECNIIKMTLDDGKMLCLTDFCGGYSVYSCELQPYKEENTFGECVEEAIQECLFGKEETVKDNNNFILTGKINTVIFQEQNYEDKVELDLGDNYEIKVEGGKTYVVKKKRQYPKTYEESCKVLGIEEDLWFVYEDMDDNHINPACISNYRMRRLDLYHNLEKLLICRDAYWKIAGELQGLGKPWEPDWKIGNEEKYCIIAYLNEIDKDDLDSLNCILAFPIEEMRNVFLENFKDLIEQCKELL